MVFVPAQVPAIPEPAEAVAVDSELAPGRPVRPTLSSRQLSLRRRRKGDGTWSNDRWEGPPRELASFYDQLLGMRIVREDWLVIAEDESSSPRLAFDGLSDYQPPRWPDPEYPQQLHLDIAVGDLEASEDLVFRRGATPLQDRGEFRSYADPAGHPFCLYPDAAQGGKEGGRRLPDRIERVVFDCFSPRALAAFYGELLGLRTRVQDSPDRVVIAADDGSLPMLAFQHAPKFNAPRWPDPAYPQQLHLDLDFDDGKSGQELAERLGAIRLPEMGGSCPVYADPSAHPFCLCSAGQ
jgi:catechol 2,3-dioxygenase-like lactoylglutathione lyase family enzyme